jgi:serine protease Do
MPCDGRVYESFADVAAQAIPGVVNIRTTTYTTRDDPSLDVYQYFLGNARPKSSASHSVGSGVVIDRKGHILTNHHVVKDANVIEVLFADKNKTKVKAKVIGTDVQTDLALLEVDKIAGQPLDMGDSDKLRVGDVVIAIGNPFGYAHTVTSGIISATGRVIGTGPYDNFLQTDAAIHPGNSGGPLIDLRSRVIGINSAVSAEGPGIGFALPINMAKRVMGDLLAFGKVRRPWLGIVGKNILSRDDIEAGAGTSGVFGVIVSNLIVDGPGFKAGLKIGDLIMGIGSDDVMDMHHLNKILHSKDPAETLRMKVYRRGEGFKHVSIALQELPKSQDLPIEKDLL